MCDTNPETEENILIVMDQTRCTRDVAIRALLTHQWDIVDAILSIVNIN